MTKPTQTADDIKTNVASARAATVDVQERSAQGAAIAPELSEKIFHPIDMSALTITTSLDAIDIQAARVFDLQMELDRLSRENASLKADAVKSATRWWLGMAGLGVLAFAVGVGLLLSPLKGWGMMVIGFGVVLATSASFMAVSMPAFATTAAWLIPTVFGIALVVVLIVIGVVLWRWLRVESTIGIKSQDKLIANGDSAGAAALAYASAGGGDKGWNAAKLIEHDAQLKGTK